MTGESRPTPQMNPTARWLALGSLFVAAYGIMGYWGQDRVATGFLAAGIALMLVLGAYALWQRSQQRHPVPAAEYLAVVWLLGYLSLLVIDTIAENDPPSIDWLVLLPPVSFIPPALRRLLRDDGRPRGLARTTAYYAHQVLGFLLCALGLLMMVSLFYLVVAPLPLLPGIMHLRAGHLYRQQRIPEPEPQPRPGLME